MKTFTFEIPATAKEVVTIKAEDYDAAVKRLLDYDFDDSHVPEVEWSETVNAETAKDFLLGE